MERLTKYAIPALGKGTQKKLPCFSEKIAKIDCPRMFCHKAEFCDNIKNRECPYLQVIDRLAAYEDTGLEPEEVTELMAAHGTAILELSEYRSIGIAKHLLELAQAEQDGRLVVLPFVAMVEQSLQKGKMTPTKDQRFNGRYAVVYVDKKKWASPLIDICGTEYNREEAEKRLAELTCEEAEAALKKRE